MIISNFDSEASYNFDLKIPSDLFETLRIKMGRYRMKDQLGSEKQFEMQVNDSTAVVSVGIEPLESFILSF